MHSIRARRCRRPPSSNAWATKYLCRAAPYAAASPRSNSGYWNEARPIARGVLKELLGDMEGADAMVIPSGSCGAMLKDFYGQLFAGEKEESRAIELSQSDVGARLPHRVTFPNGCHGLRELGVQSQPRQLLQSVRALELIEMGEAQTCCAFAAKFAAISTAMGEVKNASAVETGAEFVVSNDSSSLMHMAGLLARQKAGLKCLHLAEVLAGE